MGAGGHPAHRENREEMLITEFLLVGGMKVGGIRPEELIRPI